MRLWQQIMIRLASSGALRRHMQGGAWTAALARGFVAGRDLSALRDKVEELQGQGILSSVYYLGEYLASEELVEANVGQILRLIDDPRLAPSAFLSVDPTQIGYSIDDELGYRNAQRIGQAFVERARMRFLMIDMEDVSYVERSIRLHDQLRDQGVPVAVTLQAYLHRTAEDVERLGLSGATIRLCKGAFIAPRSVALTRRSEIEAAFLRLGRRLACPDMKAAGARTLLATHDDRLIEALLPELRANGWEPGQYEIEMLLGVREVRQRQLARSGHTVRVYVPYGEHWWPYLVRRIGENPANLRLVLRALRGR